MSICYFWKGGTNSMPAYFFTICLNANIFSDIVTTAQ